MGQPIDVSIPAIQIAMDAHGITDQKTCLLQVMNLWHERDGKKAGQDAS